MAKTGRKKGGSSKGYTYKKGRGWYAYNPETQKIEPLVDEQGERLRDRGLAPEVVRQAYARWLLHHREVEKSPVADEITMGHVCLHYLQSVRSGGATQTFILRANTLFDFCTGLPQRWRKRGSFTTKEGEAEDKERDRLHSGFGGLRVSELTHHHMDQWLAAHPKWKRFIKGRVRCVKRALNYCVKSKLISQNPISDYPPDEVMRKRMYLEHSRATYITPEQEQVLCDIAHPAFRTAIQVCIRTGARPACEFAAVTRRHIRDFGDRMEWRFAPHETKTKTRERVIRITDPATVEIVRHQIKKHPTGPIFRNSCGRPWLRQVLSQAFNNCKKKAQARGIEFDEDVCMYSCRHTYAKRSLEGYWTGKPLSIEVLAELMGNTPEVCRNHYLKWSEAHNDIFWRSC